MAKPKVDIVALIKANDERQLEVWQEYGFPVGKKTLQDLRNHAEDARLDFEQKGLARQVYGWAQIELADRGHGNQGPEERAASLKSIAEKMGNKDTLRVRYLAIGKQIDLPGHLMHFKDDYSPKWKAEEVYGRMDPIITYQGTPRKVTLAWEVDAPSDVSAVVAGRVGDLIKFLYPVYEDSGADHAGTGTMTAAPLLRISMVTNRHARVTKNANGTKTTTTVASSFMGGKTGFLIAVDSFDIEKYTAAGGQDFSVKRLPAGGILPIKYTITMGGTVFHEDAKPGWVWTKDSTNGVSVSFGTKMGATYPYGQRGAVDTYRTPEQARAAVNARAKAGSAAAQASNANIDGITAADPEAYQPTGGAISSTVDDVP
jgi:hypothetical protein